MSLKLIKSSNWWRNTDVKWTRLSNHSSNETVLRHAAEDYQKALKKMTILCQAAVQTNKSEYKQQNMNTYNRIHTTNCKINIIWFNLPFSKTSTIGLKLFITFFMF